MPVALIARRSDGRAAAASRSATAAVQPASSDGMAVLSRATSALEKRGPEKGEEEARLARLFVGGARRRIVGHLKDMDRNVDTEMTAVSETAYRDLSYAFSYWE